LKYSLFINGGLQNSLLFLENLREGEEHMGNSNSNSGRRGGGRLTSEATQSLVLEMASLTRAGLEPGLLARTTLHYGEELFPVELTIDIRGENAGFIDFAHDSREAYRLGYACQRETRTDRLMRKAQRLHRGLGGKGDPLEEDAPEKPKGMQWRTYERKLAAWTEAKDEGHRLRSPPARTPYHSC
jgi:hypothetical protein